MSRFLKFLISFAIFVALCAIGLQWFVHSEVRKGLDRAIDDAAGLTMSYDGLSVDIFDHVVTLTDVKATLSSGQSFTADELHITEYDQRSPVPHYARVTATRLDCPVTPENFGDWTALMHQSGIDSITGNAEFDYSFNPDNKSLTLKALSLDDPKLGRLMLAGTIDGIDLDDLRMEQLVGLRLTNATLRFSDRCLTKTMVRHWSTVTSTSEERTLTFIRRELAGLAQIAASKENTVAENVMLGLRRFMGDPATMTVSLNPAKPVPVLYFFMGRDLFENMQLLNMTIETNSSDGI